MGGQVRLIGLKPDVFITGAGLVLAGISGVMSAATTQIGLLIAGYVTIALGAGVLGWGITIYREHWWSRRRVKKAWPYAAAVIAAFLLLFALFIYFTIPTRAAPKTQVAPAKDMFSPIAEPKGYWRLDSIVGDTVFFRIVVCSPEELVFVSSYLIVPNGNFDSELPEDAVLKEDPKCKVLRAGQLPMSRITRPMILAVAYQKLGHPETLQTTAYFYTPIKAEATTTKPDETETLPGNRVKDYRMKELLIVFSQSENEATFILPEMFAGAPVQMGFGAYYKAFLYEPLTRLVAFCGWQKGTLTTRSASLDPKYAAGHNVTLKFDDNKKILVLTVDGRNIPQTKGYGDEQCKRSIRPVVRQ